MAGDAGAIDLRIAGTVDETFLSALKALRYDQAAPLTGSPAWLTAWVTQVMRPCGRDGLFISGHDAAGRPVLALALEIVQRLGGRVAVSLGADAFANHAIALDPTLAAALDADAAEALLVEIMRASRQIDAILLRNVPGDVAGRENPFLGTRAIRAPNDNFERSIGPDYAALYTATFSSRERRNHARQRRRLDELGDGAARLILTSGSDATHAARTLDTFYAFKAQQLAEIGAPDPFADVQLRAFYADALARAEDAAEQTPLFALLEVAGAPAAVLIGVQERGCFTTLMSAIGSGPVVRTGPGEVLLQEVMQTLCARGVTVFDF
ncbi:MAG: GNAT family N-acetyltransferase, partial [Pseudomonadota bacterium]